MGRFVIARFWGLRLQNLAISFFRFPFLAKHDSVAASEGERCDQRGRDDEIRRSVPSAAGSDHQPQARTGTARLPGDWDFIDGEIAPL